VGTNIVQYRQTAPAVAAGANITAMARYPQDTVNGNVVLIGNSGEDTGAICRTFMQETLNTGLLVTRSGGTTATTNTSYFVTYLGTSDFQSVSTGVNAATQIAYNGVLYDFNGATPGPIQNGQYSFWSVEHLMDAGLAGIQASFKTSLANQIKGQANDKTGLQLTGMAVNHNGDGGIITTGSY
jgi:hypothetical protein